MLTDATSPIEHVYPGHPLSLALDIMRRYPSYQAAISRNPELSEPEAALRNDALPGTAAHIRAALELLDYALDADANKAAEVAAEFWAQQALPFGADVVRRGQLLANEQLHAFIALTKTWPRKA